MTTSTLAFTATAFPLIGEKKVGLEISAFNGHFRYKTNVTVGIESLQKTVDSLRQRGEAPALELSKNLGFFESTLYTSHWHLELTRDQVDQVFSSLIRALNRDPAPPVPKVVSDEPEKPRGTYIVPKVAPKVVAKAKAKPKVDSEESDEEVSSTRKAKAKVGKAKVVKRKSKKAESDSDEENVSWCGSSKCSGECLNTKKSTYCGKPKTDRETIREEFVSYFEDDSCSAELKNVQDYTTSRLNEIKKGHLDLAVYYSFGSAESAFDANGKLVSPLECCIMYGKSYSNYASDELGDFKVMMKPRFSVEWSDDNLKSYCHTRFTINPVVDSNSSPKDRVVSPDQPIKTDRQVVQTKFACHFTLNGAEVKADDEAAFKHKWALQYQQPAEIAAYYKFNSAEESFDANGTLVRPLVAYIMHDGASAAMPRLNRLREAMKPRFSVNWHEDDFKSGHIQIFTINPAK